jgi:hypothetical protein
LSFSDAKPTGELLAETFLVVGDRDPCLLLRLAIIVAGQLLDAGDEDRRQHRRVGGKKRSQGRFG